MTWERVHMGYASTCDTCGAAIKRRDHAYLIGTGLACATCFAATDAGKRLKRADKARRKPMTKAQSRYLNHR